MDIILKHFDLSEHPEIRKGECFYTNAKGSTEALFTVMWLSLDGVKARVGKQAFTSGGKILSPCWKPVFTDQESIKLVRRKVHRILNRINFL